MKPAGSSTARLLALLAFAAVTLAGCSWFSSADKNGKASVSVFTVRPGQCFAAPAEVKAELSDLSRVPCTRAHTQEAYANVQYQSGSAASSGSASSGAYPGADVLDKFAKGACAQHFASYVGVDYQDSSLFFTYLLPSARSWEQDDDRTVLCFVTTTGGTLTTSVKGTHK